jgi:hypothetical protein
MDELKQPLVPIGSSGVRQKQGYLGPMAPATDHPRMPDLKGSDNVATVAQQPITGRTPFIPVECGKALQPENGKHPPG